MVIDKIIPPEELVRKALEKKKFIVQYLPNKLKPLTLIKKLQYKGHNLKTVYLIDIIHNLIQKYYHKRENSFKLNATILKEKYGYKYNHYINYLKDENIIHQTGKHVAGRTSRKYRLDSDVLSSDITRWNNSDKILIKKWIKRKYGFELNENPIIPKNVKAKMVVDLFSVEIDGLRSMCYLNTLKDPDNDIYNRNAHSVESIDKNHLFFHFDGYGRMHTNFTILKSFIRKTCLLMDGEETFEVDIANSQPRFLSKMIEDSGTRWVNKEEFDVFKTLLVNGNFYQFLVEKLNLKTKKDAKKMTYKVLFGRNHINSKPDIAFCKLFPSIHHFITLYKAEHKNYRMLSYKLQEMESNVIFNRVIQRIMLIDPNIKMVTVHDSIIGKQSDRVIIESVFNDELDNFFN